MLVGVIMVAVGIVVAAGATWDRRRRWRQAAPFSGDEQAAPEPVLVPNAVVFMVYAGWLLALAGLVLLVALA